MKIKTLLCGCKGDCPALKNVDMSTLPSEIESELDVEYAAVHPQLCEPGGKGILSDVMRSATDDPDTYVLVGACAPPEQLKHFRKLLRESDLDPKRFVPVDIQETTNEGILERIGKQIEALVQARKKPH